MRQVFGGVEGSRVGGKKMFLDCALWGISPELNLSTTIPVVHPAPLGLHTLGGLGGVAVQVEEHRGTIAGDGGAPHIGIEKDAAAGIARLHPHAIVDGVGLPPRGAV